MNLIFDVSNIYHRSYSVVSNYVGFDIRLKKYQDILLRKFLIDCSSIINKFQDLNISSIFFVFDSSSWRKKINREYKSNRSSKDPEFYSILESCYDLFNKNFNSIKINTLEADDIIMLIANKLNEEINLIISNDKDMLQLVNKKTFVFTANNSNYKCYCKDQKDLSNYYSLALISQVINPEYVIFNKILLGDKSDNILRIVKRGIGEKRVENLFLSYDKSYNLLSFIIDNKLCEIENINSDLVKNQERLIVLDEKFLSEESIIDFNKAIDKCSFKSVKEKIQLEHFL